MSILIIPKLIFLIKHDLQMILIYRGKFLNIHEPIHEELIFKYHSNDDSLNKDLK